MPGRGKPGELLEDCMTDREFVQVDRNPKRLLADIHMAALNLHSGLLNLQEAGMDFKDDPIFKKMLTVTGWYLKDKGGA
jgi:hypothetical protein